MNKKLSFILWPLSKNVKFNFHIFGWRVSCRCHYFFTNILETVENVFLIGLFKFFTANYNFSYWFATCRTLTQRIDSTDSWNAFSSVHFTFCAIFHLSFWVLNYMAWVATLQLILAELCWSNNIVAQRFSTAVSKYLLYVLQRDIANWISQLLRDVQNALS